MKIPMSNQPLPHGAAETADEPEELILTLEKVISAPSWAEDQLHASLTLRALRWLELLEQDDNTPPQPGKRVVGLDTQVEMFKVISDWLKTSKKTKSEGTEEGGAPGIEQMREVIRQEMAKLPEKPPPEVEDDEDEDDDEVDVIAEKRAGRTATRRARGKPGKPALAQRKADSEELDIIIARAREASYRED